MRFSVVLNTFDRGPLLALVLRAWARLPADRFTLIVADDGSGDDTDTVVRRIGPTVPYRLMHVRHAYEGPRRAEILNKAAGLADEDALLFTDSDSLPAANLLDVHACHYSERRLLAGGRVRLTEAWSAGLDEDGAARGDFESQLTRDVRTELAQQHLKHSFYCWIKKRGRPHILGLNMVVPRSGFVAVNGFDNRFRGFGRVYGDLRERLKEVGVWPRSVWNEALVFQLWRDDDPLEAPGQQVAEYDGLGSAVVPADGYEQSLRAARSCLVYDNRA